MTEPTIEGDVEGPLRLEPVVARDGGWHGRSINLIARTCPTLCVSPISGLTTEARPYPTTTNGFRRGSLPAVRTTHQFPTLIFLVASCRGSARQQQRSQSQQEPANQHQARMHGSPREKLERRPATATRRPGTGGILRELLKIYERRPGGWD